MTQDNGKSKHKTLILLVGKSGSGKTTLAEHSGRLYGLRSIQSYTTRPRRTPNETGHIFASNRAFHSLKDIVAYTKYNGYEYCATAQQVEDNDLYVIDPKGVEYFKEHYHGSKNIVVVYIVSSGDPHEAFKTCYERIKERGGTIEEAAERVALDNREFDNFEKQADYVLVNKDFEDLDINAIKLDRIVRTGGLDG